MQRFYQRQRGLFYFIFYFVILVVLNSSSNPSNESVRNRNSLQSAIRLAGDIER
jgi:hypothetical protein